jgi:hypothetical protein
MSDKIQHLVNHIALVIDESGSMQGRNVEPIVDATVESLKERSIALDQETRVSIYTFNDSARCLVFDMDVMRFKTIRGMYSPDRYTALLDAMVLAIEDAKLVSQKYDDHAFLIYGFTDGQENRSRNKPEQLSRIINLLPENFTLALMVPDQRGVFDAKGFGFPSENIAVWNTESKEGFKEVGARVAQVTNSYMQARSQGVRGTKGLFNLDTSNLTKRALAPVDFGYQIFPIRNDCYIKDTVEGFTGKSYVVGNTFYQPAKAVKIQDYKQILVMDNKTNSLYTGDNIRQLLGIPDNTVEVNPGNYKDWTIFVQSTSTNRKLIAGTRIVVRNY